MFKFLIFIIAIQINYLHLQILRKIAVLSIKHSIYIMWVFGIKLSNYTVSVISKSIKMHTRKKQDIIKKISNSLSWNLEYDWHLTC